ncbi:MAG TPA: hypothetical protein VFH08_19805 [Chitinophagaceae bacterium]|nr:hypothetical protein [Chitinophagaceae bacterium]
MPTLTSYPILNGNSTLDGLELYKTNSLANLESLDRDLVWLWMFKNKGGSEVLKIVEDYDRKDSKREY